MTRSVYRKLGSLLATTSVAAVFCTSGAYAQDAQSQPVPADTPAVAANANQSSASGDIIVTARKRAERLQDVPVAVSAINGEALAEANITQVQDIQQKVPGLTMVPSAFGSNMLQVAIRGQRQYDPYITKDPAVAVYFAEVVQNRPQGINSGLFDLESVQVLKGPQGTLFGRNTTGGAVLISPVTPTDEFEGYVTAGVGNYAARRLEGALNIPITETLAVRLAGSLVRRDGYTRSVTTGQKLDDQHKDSYRVSVRWTPTDNIENRLVATWFEADENGSAYKLLTVVPSVLGPTINASNLSIFPVPVRASTRGITLDGFLADFARTQNLPFHSTTSDLLLDTDIRTFTVSNVTEVDLGGATLKNVFGYRRVISNVNFDLDGSSFNLFPSLENMQERQYSDELQLLGTAFDGSLDYIIGAFYFKEKGSDYQRSNALLGDRESFADPVTNEAYSFFGQVTYRLPFLPNVSLTGGVRQNYDIRSLTARSRTNGVCRLVDADIGGVPLNPCERDLKEKYKKLTYTLTADWKILPDTMVYFAHRQGYRTGGFNFSGGTPSTLIPFRPEVVKDYEIGLKSKFEVGGARGIFNVAAYKQDYSDIQRSIGFFIEGLFVNGITNAASATIKGIEADLTLTPVDNLDLTASISHIDAKYSGFIDNGVDVSGSAFAGAPKWSWSLGAAYTVPLGEETGDLLLRGDAYHQSKTSWSDSNFDIVTKAVDPVTFTEEYTLLNARVEWRNVMGKPLSIGVFGKNLTDKEYIASGTWLSKSFGLTAGYTGEPRTYGVEVKYQF